MEKSSLHYAWIIVLSGVFALFSCLGLGRFALGMLLPSMGSSLELSYSQMGIISTGNFIGYLIAVLICSYLIKQLGERRTISFGLLLVGISMLLVSLSSSFLLIALLYLCTGIGTGAANITVMSLVTHWFAPKYRGRAAGLMIVGNGLGIVASGVLIPLLNTHWAEDGWRIGWAGFAVFILLAALLTAFLIRNKPGELALKAYGDKPGALSGAQQQTDTEQLLPKRLIGHLGLIYFLFGFTYVIYATFIVTTLVQEYQFSEARAGVLWMGIGIISVFSGALFGTVSDKFGRKTGLVSVYLCQTFAYALVALSAHPYALYLSMALFGLTAFSIPAIIAAAVSDYFSANDAARVFGYVTFFFALGQIAGPSLAGYMAELNGSFSSSYLLAALMTAGAIGLTLLLNPHKEKTAVPA